MILEGGMNILNILLNGLKVESKRDGRINRNRTEDSKGKFDALLLSFSQLLEEPREPDGLKVKRGLPLEIRSGALRLEKLAGNHERKNRVIGINLLPGRTEVISTDKLEGRPVNVYSSGDRRKIWKFHSFSIRPEEIKLNTVVASKLKLQKNPKLTFGKVVHLKLEKGERVERKFDDRYSSVFREGISDRGSGVFSVVPVQTVNHYFYHEKRSTDDIQTAFVSVAVLQSSPSLWMLKKGTSRSSSLTVGKEISFWKGIKDNVLKFAFLDLRNVKYKLYSKSSNIERIGLDKKSAFETKANPEFSVIEKEDNGSLSVKPTKVLGTDDGKLINNQRVNVKFKNIAVTPGFVTLKGNMLSEYRYKATKILVKNDFSLKIEQGIQQKEKTRPSKKRIETYTKSGYDFGNIKGKFKIRSEKSSDRDTNKASFPPGKLPAPERAVVDRRSPPPVHLFTLSVKVPRAPLSETSHSIQRQHTENSSQPFSTSSFTALPLDHSFSLPNDGQSSTGKENYPSHQFYEFGRNNEAQISYVDKNFKLSVMTIGRVLNLNLQILDEFHLDPSTVRDITTIIESSGYVPGKIVLRYRKERYATYESRSAKRLELKI